MIYVVKRDEIGTILNRCDAWEENGEQRMRRWCRDNGWVLTKVEITFNGDMVLWVE